MKVTIEIECESITEFHAHLHELRKQIRKQIRKQAKKLKLNPLENVFPSGVDLDDDNCYGSHTVTISNEY